MREFKNLDLFQYDHGPYGVQEAVLMGRVMVEAVLAQDFKVIKADMAIKADKATRVVIIIRGVSSSSSRVTRATRSSLIVGSIVSSPLACASAIRSFIKGQ